MHHHSLTLLPDGWTNPTSWNLWRRCDDCHRLLFFVRMYECYPPLGSKHGWWYQCANCMVADLTDMLEAEQHALSAAMLREELTK